MKIAILSRNRRLYSTRRLVEAARARGHEAVVVDYAKCVVALEQRKPTVFYAQRRLTDIDAIVPRIGASATFFGAAIVRQFEIMKVFAINGSQAIVRSRDKLRSLQILAKSGLGIPKTVFAKFPKNKDVEMLIEQVGGPPVVIKQLEGTQGLGVVLAETYKTAKSVIEAFSGLRTNILIQEYVEETAGSDIRAFVVGNRVIGAMRRQGTKGEFRSNLHRGGRGTPVTLSKTEENAAIKAARILGLRMAGVDIFQSARGPLIVEVNSSPGLEGIEQATHLDVAGPVIEFIEHNVARPAGLEMAAPAH